MTVKVNPIVAAPMPAFPVLIISALLMIFTPTSASAAVVNVGHNISTDSAFMSDGAQYVQSVLDSNGVLPVSPDTMPFTDFLAPNTLFSTTVITREAGETDTIRLENVVFQRFSNDSAGVFDKDVQLYAGVDYDGTLIRGFTAGDDDTLFTSDDVELSDGAADADLIVIYGIGSNFDDDAVSRAYFSNEVEFTVMSQFVIVNDGSTTLGARSYVSTVTNPVPEPGSIVLITVGSLALLRRRVSSRSF